LPEGQSYESIDQDLLTDCAQLTKANSIEGMYDEMFIELLRGCMGMFGIQWLIDLWQATRKTTSRLSIRLGRI
jgi:hypothetical protein